MKKNGLSDSLRDYAPYTSMGIQLIIPILGGVFGGRWLDKEYDTGSTWTVILAIAGIVVGMYTFIKTALKPTEKKKK